MNLIQDTLRSKLLTQVEMLTLVEKQESGRKIRQLYMK